MATPRRSLSALAISSSAALIRISQLEAALQPSSSRMTSGALLPAAAPLRAANSPDVTEPASAIALYRPSRSPMKTIEVVRMPPRSPNSLCGSVLDGASRP